MEIFQSVIAHQITYILGIVNLLTALLVLLTCRCMGGAHLSGKLMKYAAYKWLFTRHCVIWWFFWISVVIHAIFALAYFGVPF